MINKKKTEKYKQGSIKEYRGDREEYIIPLDRMGELIEEKTMNKIFEKGRKVGYGMAINDFLEELVKTPDTIQIGWGMQRLAISLKKIQEIAEKLKIKNLREMSEGDMDKKDMDKIVKKTMKKLHDEMKGRTYEDGYNRALADVLTAVDRADREGTLDYGKIEEIVGGLKNETKRVRE